jgi:hypothetical protein
MALMRASCKNPAKSRTDWVGYEKQGGRGVQCGTGKEATVVKRSSVVGIAMEEKLIAKDPAMISNRPKPGSLEASGSERSIRVWTTAERWVSSVARALV